MASSTLSVDDPTISVIRYTCSGMNFLPVTADTSRDEDRRLPRATPLSSRTEPTHPIMLRHDACAIRDRYAAPRRIGRL